VVRSICDKSSGNVNGFILIIVMAMAMAAPVSAQATCPPDVPFPPALPTELYLNLLNTDGTNIDTSLLLTIDYLDADGCPQSMDSSFPDVYWLIYDGQLFVYALVPALSGTDINITIEGYEMLQVTAIENGVVEGDYYPIFRLPI